MGEDVDKEDTQERKREEFLFSLLFYFTYYFLFIDVFLFYIK